jgi:hypothetical protein
MASSSSSASDNSLKIENFFNFKFNLKEAFFGYVHHNTKVHTKDEKSFYLYEKNENGIVGKKIATNEWLNLDSTIKENRVIEKVPFYFFFPVISKNNNGKQQLSTIVDRNSGKERLGIYLNTRDQRKLVWNNEKSLFEKQKLTGGSIIPPNNSYIFIIPRFNKNKKIVGASNWFIVSPQFKNFWNTIVHDKINTNLPKRFYEKDYFYIAFRMFSRHAFYFNKKVKEYLEKFGDLLNSITTKEQIIDSDTNKPHTKINWKRDLTDQEKEELNEYLPLIEEEYIRKRMFGKNLMTNNKTRKWKLHCDQNKINYTNEMYNENLVVRPYETSYEYVHILCSLVMLFIHQESPCVQNIPNNNDGSFQLNSWDLPNNFISNIKKNHKVDLIESNTYKHYKDGTSDRGTLDENGKKLFWADIGMQNIGTQDSTK